MGIDKPKNIEEAVSIVMDSMSLDQKDELHQVSEDNLINLHFGFGMWVRNLLGHWVPPADEGQYPGHPDDVSGIITKLIWRKLHDLA